MASLRFRLRQQYWRWTAPLKFRRYLALPGPHKLQIGSGHNLLGGWLNSTLYPIEPGAVFMDAARSFPVPAGTLDYIFSEHVIEHLEYDEALVMLRQCLRALKPGGRMRLATPDLERIIKLYSQPDGVEQAHYIRWIMQNFRPQYGDFSPAHAINQSFHGWRHKFIYDEATLRASMKGVGFQNISRVQPGESDDPNLRGLEQHGSYVGNERAMRYETMVFEAAKP